MFSSSLEHTHVKTIWRDERYILSDGVEKLPHPRDDP